MELLFRDSSPDFDPVKYEVNQTMKPIGDMTIAPVMPQTSYRERYARLKQLDNEKNVLVEDLLRQVESSQRQIQQLRFEFKQNDDLRERAESLQHEIDSMRALLDRNSYVTVLIDSDALTFPKELLSQGEKGGCEAAEQLSETMNRLAIAIVPHLTAVNIHFKLFLNTKAVADSLVHRKHIDQPGTLDDFLRGLLGGHGTFDVIDTGLIKGLTERKIKESYRHDFINVHCHQIFLATLATAEMAALLDETPNIPVHERVTLLEAKGLQADDRFEHEIQSLALDSILCKMPAEDTAQQQQQPPPPVKTASLLLARVESNSSSRTMNSAQASSTNTPVLTWAAMTAQPFVPKPGENSSNTSPLVSTVKTSPIAKPAPTVARNKHGQRVDAVDKSIPYQELQRIKKMKLCNIFYLQGKHACAGDCNHSHTYPLKNTEKNILKEVARMTPCHYRTDCDDPSCIYGHRCPQSKPDKPDCFYKQDCRFYGWGHGIDEKVVKTHSIK